MKYIFYLSFVLIFLGCKTRRVPFHEGGGAIVREVDSSLRKEITIIKLRSSIGVIFPAAAVQKIFETDTPSVIFFTPDTNLIRRVNKEIDYQYYSARKRFILAFFKPESKDKVEFEKDHPRSFDVLITDDYNGWLNDGAFYDRQFYGYVEGNGEKVIRIKLYDFRKDPKRLKGRFAFSLIDGWHGWFYSNIMNMSFYVNQNLFVIH